MRIGRFPVSWGEIPPFFMGGYPDISLVLKVIRIEHHQLALRNQAVVFLRDGYSTFSPAPSK